jgi:uncharacterized damage-inducible protein DinB
MRSTDIELLVGYLYWMRDRVLDAAKALGPDEFVATAAVNGRDLRQTLVHELDVEWSWRQRLRDAPPEAWGPEAELRVEDYPTVEALAAHWRRDEAEMRSWIAGLSDEDLETGWTAGGLEGFPLWYYLMHILGHGIQQLTGAAAILSDAGHSPGDLDFLNAVDDRERPGG